MSALNETLFFARYAKYLTLCLQAALQLDIVGRHNKGNQLSAEDLAALLEIDPIAGRSFFNVLVALGVLKHDNGGLSVTQQAHADLSQGSFFSLAPYLQLGTAGDATACEFFEFLKNPKNGSPLYAIGGEVSLMDDTTGIAKSVAFDLASRAKRFAFPLATLIANKGNPTSNICDLGAGSPFLANELIRKLSKARVILADRGNALRFVYDMAAPNGIEFQTSCKQLKEGQIGILDCNMFVRETLPRAGNFDFVVFSNVLHDWNLEQVARIIENSVGMLKNFGTFVVHETFMGTSKDPLWMAAYGMALNHLTLGQGSCYYPEEYDKIFKRFGFKRREKPTETRDGCFALFYEREQ